MAQADSNYSTPSQAFEQLRQQWQTTIEAIEQEALAAARSLGIKGPSKKAVMAAVDRELAAWERRYGHGPDWLYEHYESAPREYDRAVCLDVISEMIDDTRLFFTESLPDDWDYVGRVLDSWLNVLRQRLPRATFAYRAAHNCP